MKWHEAISRFNIGRIYHEASLDDVQEKVDRNIAKAGRKWLEANYKQSLYLSGNPGSGKTYFSVCLLKELIESQKHPWIIYTRSYEIDDELLVAVDERRELSVLQKYHEVPILFIDDLGVERVSDRIMRQYYSIIDTRINNFLPTVFTSNIPIEGIYKTLGDRIASRLEMAFEIKFPNKDLRKEFVF